MAGRVVKALLLGLSCAALAGVGGFVAGRVTAPTVTSASGAVSARPLAMQAQRVQLPGAPQDPNDPRELIPLLPGPGEGGPGQPGQGPGQGPPQPGQGQGQEECPVLLLQDGQLYRIQPRGPGQQPGQEPGGPGDGGQGQPGEGNELFPLEPYEGPSPIPGIPSTPRTRTI